MSVMMLSEKLYSTVLDNIGRYHKQPYFMPLRMDVEPIIPVLYLLNYKSYNARYREDNTTGFIPFRYCKDTVDISPFQLLKYLQCIRYQIEKNICVSFEGKQAVNYLDEWIEGMTNGILRSIPEYENAKWSEV